MFSFLLEGPLGSLVAPEPTPWERVVLFLSRDQTDKALEVLSSMVGPAVATSTSADPDSALRRAGQALHLACKLGQVPVIQAVVAAGADVHTPGDRGRSPLLVAAASGHEKAVAVLLEKGADPLARDLEGQDAIALAPGLACRRRIEHLFSTHAAGKGAAALASGVAGVAPSSAMPLPPRPAPALGAAAGVVQAPRTPPQRPQPSTTSVCTPLSSSGVRQGTPRKALAPEIAELVVQAAADTADAVVAKNQWKRVNDLFLSLRTKSDKFDKAKLRARLAADPSLITTRVSTRLDGRHRDGFTLLHTAAECGHTAAIETILEFDEAPRAIWSVDLQGRTPLHIAAEAGKLRACRLLKEAMIQNGQSPVGASAPVDLSGLTPAAWNARAESALRSKPRVNQEELTDRSALKELLFAPGDPGVLPATPFQTRSGGAVQVFGISDAPGWRVSMEDAHCAYSPLPGHADTGLCLFAIFDGHGGAFSARFAASQIGRRIAEHPATKSFPLDPGALSQALVDVILALDQDLAAQPVMQPTPKYRAEDASGATVLVALTTPTHLLVANCGDSHGVLLRADGQGFVPIAVASPHSPQLEAEAKRIHMAGHRVENGRVDGNLAVSRAIGDFQFKTPGVAPENQAVSPVPEVKIIPRTMKDEMLFMACDGIWDVMTEDDIAAFAMRARPEAGYQAPSELTQFCDSIIMEACVERCSGDNVSAIAVSMLHTSSQSSSQLARRIDFGEESEDAAT